ncbi:MlaE family ABC transporter permease [Pararhodobacter zhoushanensis]|uniref:MlaE family ABC transporter permease n=1 Tax=Pararhodobacter zhoushanensis TaxID=2479545 RepID=UPI000F8D4324|nr:ABC transporter permease [Pararhodobacter zhoushanensis]
MTAAALLGATGRSFAGMLGALGRFVGFAGQAVGWMLRRPFHLRELGVQLIQIGWLSLPVVGMTALFTGAALALQIFAGSARYGAEFAVPSITAIGMVRELGPVLGGLMVAARVASSIAAEIGTMKVSEQIDALRTLAVEPMQYLTVPRLLAATLAMPVLVAVGDSIGILGGYAVGVTRLGFDGPTYLANTLDFLEFWDIGSGLVKGAVFGFLVALSGCYFGMTSGRGAQGVGEATKSAVVLASVLILASNYLLTEAFFTS